MLLSPSLHRKAAKKRLAATQKPGRVILLHTGIVMLFSLLLVLADYLLDQQISKTGGLRGLSYRPTLITIQVILRLLQVVLLPFWQVGYTYYTLRVARGEDAKPGDLLEGFRRFFPVLRLKLLTAGMLIALAVISFYSALILFTMTPQGEPLMGELEALLTDPNLDYMVMATNLLTMLEPYALQVSVLFGLCFVAGGVFLFLQFRKAELWLLDHPGKGAFASIKGSLRCMRGNRIGMLRIDFSYWWFYLLELLICVLSFGDLIIDAIGLEMTTDTFVSYLIFFGLSLWLQLMLYWWKRNEVAVTYADAYLAICPEEIPEEQTAKV